jgi:hypothetical protein
VFGKTYAHKLFDEILVHEKVAWKVFNEMIAFQVFGELFFKQLCDVDLSIDVEFYIMIKSLSKKTLCM